MLTTEEMNAIVRDVTLGRKELSVEGEEAKRFAERIKPEIEKAKKEGRVVGFAKEALL